MHSCLAHQLAALPMAALLSTLPPQAINDTEPAKIGEHVPDYEFRPIDSHDGRTRLSELYGHPVLIVGWRQWIPDGLHAVWFANELADKYADDGLIVILRDRKFWHKDRWWGARSFWIRSFASPVWFTGAEPDKTKPLPIVRERSKRDDRSLVLIGVDGRLLVEGTAPSASEKEHKDGVRRRIRETLAEELKKRKRGWGPDSQLQKARGLAFGKGKLASALATIERSKASDADKALVRAEVERALDAEIVSVRYLVERGRFLEAEELWKSLRSGCKGAPELVAKVHELDRHFEGKQAKQAKRLARRLDKILKPIAKRDWRKIDLDSLFELRELAAEHGNNPVGKRAARLDPLIKDLARIAKGWMPKTIEEAIRRRQRKGGE